MRCLAGAVSHMLHMRFDSLAEAQAFRQHDVVGEVFRVEIEPYAEDVTETILQVCLIEGGSLKLHHLVYTIRGAACVRFPQWLSSMPSKYMRFASHNLFCSAVRVSF
jgi:hypothetical protein